MSRDCGCWDPDLRRLAGELGYRNRATYEQDTQARAGGGGVVGVRRGGAGDAGGVGARVPGGGESGEEPWRKAGAAVHGVPSRNRV